MREQRFFVTESSGYAMTPSGDTGRWVTEVMVLDSAYFDKLVWSSLTSVMENHRHYMISRRARRKAHLEHKVFKGTGQRWPLEKRRAYAVELCERLNREYAEWLAA